MADRIGPTFPAELTAAGLGAGISWDRTSGALSFTNVSDVDQAKAQQVLAAHDPTKQLPRQVHVSDLLDALSPTQRAAITADHMQRLQARAAKGTVTAADPKLVRAAADLGVAPDAWVALIPTGS